VSLCQTAEVFSSGGSAIERVDKHPFCMSRIHYNTKDKGRDVWVEMMDHSCRWTQTASEITVQALKVPPGSSKQELNILIDTRYIKIAAADGSHIYLEGELAKSVIPEESAWVHLGGHNEEGFVLYLKKMNLELFSDNATHMHSWWSRLFTCHCEIKWDDYDKDYSDLPAPVMEDHLLMEHAKEQTRQIEYKESDERDDANERNDARKRNRQERLAEMRGGSYKSWVQLNRLNPPEDPFDSMNVPGDRDSELMSK